MSSPSQTFKDASGREWTVHVSVHTLKRARACGIDVTQIKRDDLVTACDLLYLACESEAKQRNVSDEDFGRLLAGDVLEAAMHALNAAFSAFAPRRMQVAPTALEPQGATPAPSGAPSTA